MGLALDEPSENDEKVDAEGIEILVERRIRMFVEHSVVDYVDSAWGRGFTVQPRYGGGC